MAKYLQNPVRTATRKKHSKLDDFGPLIDQVIKDNPAVTGTFLQHALSNGFNGKISIVRDYLRKRRPHVLNNNRREINLHIIKCDLYRCMIKGISYLDVLRMPIRLAQARLIPQYPRDNRSAHRAGIRTQP